MSLNMNVVRILGLVLALPTGALAQAGTSVAQGLPTAAVLLERHVAAVGGRQALERPQSSQATGRFEVPAQGIAGSLAINAASPSLLSVTIDIPGIGVIRSGYNGEVGWAMHPAMGPMVMEGRQLDQMRQQADFRDILNSSKYIASRETVEETNFEGRPSYKVKVVTKWDEEYFEFFDKETGLLAGNIRHQESPMGAVEVTTFTQDYTEFGGIKVPTKIVQRLMGQEQRFMIESIEFDSVDPSVFALPEAIRVLVGSQ